MPTFKHGKDTVILLGGRNVSEFFNTAAWNQSADTAETTAFGASARSFIPSFPGGSFSMGGMFDGTASTGIDAILNGMKGVSTALIYVPELLVDNVRAKFATVQLSNYQIGSPVGDLVGISTDFVVDTTMDTAPLGLALDAVAQGATVNGVVLDGGASSTAGAVAAIQVTSNTLSGNLTVTVEHDTVIGMGSAAVLATFTVIPGGSVSGQQLSVASGVTINRYTRIKAVAAAGTGTATITGAFARR